MTFPTYVRSALAASLIAASVLVTGCANFYVDTALKDIEQSELRIPAEPRATQLVFEFQTKGTPNAGATAQLKEQVVALVGESQLFSEISETPVSGDGLLSIVINNVPLTEGAYAKGFVTGLTFGAAGTVVSDGYICTVEYQSGAGQKTISTTVRHAIHATIGAKGAPPNAVKAASVDEAIKTMTRQIVRNGLKNLSQDPAFLH